MWVSQKSKISIIMLAIAQKLQDSRSCLKGCYTFHSLDAIEISLIFDVITAPNSCHTHSKRRDQCFSTSPIQFNIFVENNFHDSLHITSCFMSIEHEA